MDLNSTKLKILIGAGIATLLLVLCSCLGPMVIGGVAGGNNDLELIHQLGRYAGIVLCGGILVIVIGTAVLMATIGERKKEIEKDREDNSMHR